MSDPFLSIFSQLNPDHEVRPGDLLISEPLMEDENFQRSVVLICEHDVENGTFGLIINQKLDAEIDDITAELDLQDNLYIGGPVEQNTLHLIHTYKDITNARPLRDGLYWGGDYEDIKRLSQLGMLKPDKCRFCLGYSGWGKGQLEQEIKQNAWIISRISLGLLLRTQPTHLWREALLRMGGKYRVFSNYPKDPSLN